MTTATVTLTPAQAALLTEAVRASHDAQQRAALVFSAVTAGHVPDGVAFVGVTPDGTLTVALPEVPHAD